MAREFSYPIHAFRGFAILNIVSVHAFALIFVYALQTESSAGWSLSVLRTANEVLLHDSTLYFTYISGILFSLILAERGFERFFRSKLLYVVLPYLVFTVLFSLVDWTIGTPSSLFNGTFLEFLQRVGGNLLTGQAILIFWYIPVLLILYLLTPLLANVLSMEGAAWIRLAIVTAPLICSRVWPEVSWTNYVYFLGAYVIGMTVGARYRATIQMVEKHSTLLVILAVVTTAFLAIAQHIDIPVFGFTYLAESFWYVQKLAFAGLILVWFEKAMTSVPRWLDVLGDYAFALYFIHMAFILGLLEIMARVPVRIDSGLELILFMSVSLVLGLGGSVLVTRLCKSTMGRYSRMVIGA